MITFKFISEEELKNIAKEDNNGLYTIADEELAEFCSDGNRTYAAIRYDGEMCDFMHEAEFLSPGICVPKEFNAGEGYTLPNLCAIHAVISAIFDFNAEDSLLFYDENKKHAVIILHSKRKESNNGV